MAATDTAVSCQDMRDIATSVLRNMTVLERTLDRVLVTTFCILGLRGHHTSDHRLLMYIQSTASIMYDSHTPPPETSCRPVGGCSSEDFAIRAHRRSGATFLCACQPPRQIPARARGTNDYRPSCTARRQPIFIPLMWPDKAMVIPAQSLPSCPDTGAGIQFPYPDAQVWAGVPEVR